jgi:hypothetical protein
VAKSGECSVCNWESANGVKVDTSRSKTAWEIESGISRSSIKRHLEHGPQTAPDPDKKTTEESTDGSKSVSFIRDRPVTLADARDWIRASGDDPEDYKLSIRSIPYGNGLSSNMMAASPKPEKKASAEELVTAASVIEAIRSFTYIPEPRAFSDESFVIMPTDLQTGKVDFNGGTKETVEQALESFAKGSAFVKEFRPREVCIVDAGDSIENIYSVSSQLATNDLDLPHQVEVAMNIFLEGIKMFAPLTPSVRYAAVSSNHGAHRLGPKSPAGDVHADYGIVIAKMLGHALKLNDEAFGHVQIQTPEPLMESLYFQTSGTDIGVVHSHQAGGADKIGDWWKGQSHGNMPVSKARILLAGHWHSFRVQQSGDARWIFVGPASDRGSSWFTNARGERSESGMLSFTTSNNLWDNLRVL